MEKQEVKSKWDELARQLGAEVSPEAEQLVEGTAPLDESELSVSERSFEIAQVTPPKRRSAGWDSLANEFGLPVPPPPIEPLSDGPVRAESEDVIDEVVLEAEIVQRPPRPDERPRREDRPRRDEGRRREERPRREENRHRDNKPRREREHSRDRREQPGRRRPSRENKTLEPSAAVEIEEQNLEETQVATPAPAPEERTSRGAAVSLWHKIFGSPVDQSAKVSEVSPARDESTEPSRVAESLAERQHTDADIDEPFESPISDVYEDAAIDQADAAEPDSDREAVIDRKRRRRRGRRRRGGRDDRSAEKELGENQRRRPVTTRAEDEDDDDDRIEELTTDDDELESPTGTKEDMSDGLDANGESTGATSRSRSALQRSIPSWDEAIGFIVEANMQTRSQRRPPSHSGSRSQAPRNRGRGRHKK